MKKTSLLIAAAIAAATVGVFAPSTASAHTDECTGVGTATLGAGLGLPPSKLTTGFTITLSGACLPSGGTSLTAVGTVDGACGQLKGHGTAEGHPFAFTGVGPSLVFSGGVTGEMKFFADPTRANNSCVDGTARSFQALGTVALTFHGGCSTPVNTQTPKAAEMVCTGP